MLITGLHEVYTALGREAAGAEPEIQCIPDGAILVTEGIIRDIGPRQQLMAAYGGEEIVDMGGRTAIPAFVDPHTHLVWGGDRAGEFNRRLHGANYVDIAKAGGGIKATVKQTRAATAEELTNKARRTLDHMLGHGTATIEAKTGYGLNQAAELKQLEVMDHLAGEHPVEIHQTFMGAHEVPEEYKGRPSAYIDYLNEELLPLVAQRGTVRYVDIFCERGVFELEDSRNHLAAAKALGFQLRMHADELAPLGGAGLAAELGAVTADHLIHASREDIARMATAGTTAVLLPGTSFFLRTHFADAAAFLAAGVPVALSTDFNPGSSHTISQPLMMALACMHMGLTFEQAFAAVTLNAAATLDAADRLGSLETGKQADIVFLDAPSALHLVYYWGVNHVSDVMKAGAFAWRHGRLVPS